MSEEGTQYIPDLNWAELTVDEKRLLQEEFLKFCAAVKPTQEQLLLCARYESYRRTGVLSFEEWYEELLGRRVSYETLKRVFEHLRRPSANPLHAPQSETND